MKNSDANGETCVCVQSRSTFFYEIARCTNYSECCSGNAEKIGPTFVILGPEQYLERYL